MRGLSSGLFLWALCTVQPAGPESALVFQAPSFEEPFYRIRARFEVRERESLVRDLLLNGARQPSFLVLRNGKSVAIDTPLEPGAYEFVLDYAWSGAKDYELTALLSAAGKKDGQRLKFQALSPREGGIPGTKEGFYRLFRLENETALDREQELVALTLTVPKTDVEQAAFVLYDGPNPLPFEIQEKRESVPPASVSSSNPVTLTYKLGLAADVKARGKKLLLLLRGEEGPEPQRRIVVSGEGLGKTVETSKLKLRFHPQSGQIDTIEAPGLGVKLFNKAGVIHWNPDVFVPGVAWDHSFDWNPPAVFEEQPAAFSYVSSRRGSLPRVQGVNLEVKYTLEATSAYFISESRLTFEKETGVIAVRNDEMVVYRELFDSLVYEDKGGKVVRLPLKEKRETPFGVVHIAPDDLDWVGLVNTRDGFGFFSLRLASANGNLELPGLFLHKAGTYFYAPSDGEYVYWVRPLVYTWADHFTKDLFVFVPRGSFFYEKNAYLVTALTDDLPPKLDALLLKLRLPLRVF